MLTHEKETMLNKVLQLENWIDGYYDSHFIKTEDNAKTYKLFLDIKRNLNSIKSLIKKS
jgi:hypothetical protein